MSVLVTGFRPFAGLPHNPSEALLERLPGQIHGVPIETAVLSVDSEMVRRELRTLLAEPRELVIHLGLDRKGQRIKIERVALNVLHFDDPDEAGRKIHNRPVVAGAPIALESRLDVDEILKTWTRADIPAELSHHAGTFLCNQVMFLSLTWLPASTRTGFIHIPSDEALASHLGQQAKSPLDRSAKAVELAIASTLS